MRLQSKLSHLRWLLPLLVYFIALTMLFSSFGNYFYQRAVRQKEVEMAFAIEREIDNIDFSLGKALTTVHEAGTAFSLYAFRYNKNQIVSLLNRMVIDTDMTYAYVCNLEGSGYDYQGEDVHIGSEDFFKEITEEYSRGGIGITFPDVPSGQGAGAYIVNGISFDKKERGYVIAKVPLISIADQIFALKYEADTIAVITIDGKVLSIDSKTGSYGEEDGNFYDLMPRSISKDNIKLSMTQKSIYYADAPDFGYIIVLPLDTASACAVALVDYDDMKQMVNPEIRPFSYLMSGILIASVVLMVLIIIAGLLGDFIQKKQREKKIAEIETDVVTGLMTTRSAVNGIDNYIEASGDARGIIFLIALDLDAFREGKKDFVISNDKIKDFADVLTGSFRSSDIIARTGEDEFMVFVKDIREDKDVRKQSDHMQMFLHDSRIVESGEEIAANAGAAICPDTGKSAGELMNAARAALDRAKKEGSGRLSF